jgi:predicted O-methyltransferase YrrM
LTTNLTTNGLIDPAQVGRRNRLDPLRCYLSLRRALEPHWYRSFWQTDPWKQFVSSAKPRLNVACNDDEQSMLHALDEIPSAVNADQTRVLYWLARNSAVAGDIVEIGSDQGKSTVALSWGASRSAHPCDVHAVDPFLDGLEISGAERQDLFDRNLARFSAHNVKLHRMFSGDYRRQRQAPLRVLFVDAAHDYFNSRYDFLAWRDLVSPGGFLAAHDVDNYTHGPGTRRAFMECVLKDRNFHLVLHSDNLAVAQRVTAVEA